jgi:hypothetical protein
LKNQWKEEITMATNKVRLRIYGSDYFLTTDDDTKYMPCLAIKDGNGDYHDIIEFVSEIGIVHNDIDGDDAGRNKKGNARMKRDFLENKHSMEVKLISHVPQSFAFTIRQLVYTTKSKVSYFAYYQNPCSNGKYEMEYYTSTINFGAQRYDRQRKKCFYDGINFNMIEM